MAQQDKEEPKKRVQFSADRGKQSGMTTHDLPPAVEALRRRIERCELCPRLRKHCQAIAKTKKREFSQSDYWGRPVTGFGDPTARLWIVGLAPAAHGANRTGRMFTGDKSGDWLYKILHETGFANQALSRSRDDGLVLRDVYISAAARCAPPDNKPTLQELKSCGAFLKQEAALLGQVKVVLPLGKIAWDALYRLFGKEKEMKPVRFGHGVHAQLGHWKVRMSYHPSRQNTNTGRLTWAMWSEVFQQVREEISNSFV